MATCSLPAAASLPSEASTAGTRFRLAATHLRKLNPRTYSMWVQGFNGLGF